MKNDKKKKRKENYYVVTISDNPKAPIHSFKITQGSRHFWRIVITTLIVMLIFLAALLNYRNSVLTNREAIYKATVDELQAQVDDLSRENSNLNDKVAILSDTVREKSEFVSAIEEKSIPSGFPLSMAADVVETTISRDVNGEKTDVPAIKFAVKNGTYLLAAGSGTVSRVYEVTDNYWEIEIDHGNGYTTYYQLPGKLKVKQGDEVVKGGPVCEISSEDKKPELIYFISNNDEFIDPRELLEISG